MLQSYATPCISGAAASRRVQMKVVLMCACQLPTEGAESNEDIERQTQACT
jgi:hypothetical protein